MRATTTRFLPTGKVKPDQNILVISLVAGFKDTLRERFKSSEEAFAKLVGDEDDNINAAGLNEFLIHMGYSNSYLNAQVFEYLDKDSDGYIAKSEFVALCTGHDEHVAKFKERLLARFETAKGAFSKLDTSFDNLVDRSEFEEFCVNELAYTDRQVVKQIFEAIDDDQNAVISKAEFKALFDAYGEFGLVTEFKAAIKAKFKSAMEAFEKLGGNTGGFIDRSEFEDFLNGLLGYQKKELVEQLFNLIDENGDGYISKNEFRALFVPGSLQLMEFRESVRKKYKTRNFAFEMLGGKKNGTISPEEFHESCARDFDLKDRNKIEQLFRMIDCDCDEAISRAEFKKFFLFSYTGGLGPGLVGNLSAESPIDGDDEDDEPTVAQDADAEQTFATVQNAEANSDASLGDVQDTADALLLEPTPASADAEPTSGISASNVEQAFSSSSP